MFKIIMAPWLADSCHYRMIFIICGSISGSETFLPTINVAASAFFWLVLAMVLSFPILLLLTYLCFYIYSVFLLGSMWLGLAL